MSHLTNAEVSPVGIAGADVNDPVPDSWLPSGKVAVKESFIASQYEFVNLVLRISLEFRYSQLRLGGEGVPKFRVAAPFETPVDETGHTAVPQESFRSPFP